MKQKSKKKIPPLEIVKLLPNEGYKVYVANSKGKHNPDAVKYYSEEYVQALKYEISWLVDENAGLEYRNQQFVAMF